MALSWTPPKDPDEVKDYGVDWALLLDTDTISTSTWTVPAGITKNSDSNTDTTTTVWVSGGTAGDSYLLQNRVVTAGGRTYDRTCKLKMKNL
jgi:hypothetical protein